MLGRTKGYLYNNLNLVIRAVGSSLIATYDISALIEIRLTKVGKLVATKVALNRTDNLVALYRYLL